MTGGKIRKYVQGGTPTNGNRDRDLSFGIESVAPSRKWNANPWPRRWTAGFAALLLSIQLVVAAEVIPARWTLAVIGDQQWAVTQSKGNDFLDRFSSQVDWLIAKAQPLNLRMVVQVGDIVEKAAILTEWERASGVMGKLDLATNADNSRGIPWSVAFGNHEIIGAVLRPTIDLAGPEPSLTYRQYFGSARGKHRYANQPEFRGVSPNDLNTWHIIRSSSAASARSCLMLNLEVDVPGRKEGTNFDAMAWAQSVIDANPGLPTIITTHVFEGSRSGPPNSAYLRGFGHNSQLEIFAGLIAPNPQIFMILSGHTNEDTHQIKQNAAGLPVLQMVTDYSKWVGDGGDGYFRLLEFDEASGKVHIKTYSAYLDRFRTDANGEFGFEIDFNRRFASDRAKAN